MKAESWATKSTLCGTNHKGLTLIESLACSDNMSLDHMQPSNRESSSQESPLNHKLLQTSRWIDRYSYNPRNQSYAQFRESFPLSQRILLANGCLPRRLSVIPRPQLYRQPRLHARRGQFALFPRIVFPSTSQCRAALFLRKLLHPRLQLGPEVANQALDRPGESLAESYIVTESVS